MAAQIERSASTRQPSGQTPIQSQKVLLGLLFVLIVAAPLLLRLGSPQDAETSVLPFSTFPESWDLNLREPIQNFQTWTIRNRLTHPIFTLFFDPLSDAIDAAIRALEGFLLWLPWQVVVLATFLLGVGAGDSKGKGLRTGLFCAFAILFAGFMGLWDEAMQTLSLMGVSVAIALAIGIPLGILAARSDRFEQVLRPLLDAMQTMPAFVYLIPVLLFFGIARVPSVIASVIYALPASIRLTNLGIRSVPDAPIEAARAFGSTSGQILRKVQLPLAMPAIIAGVNQTIMMAFGIVVIAALIGAGGVGREVMIALQQSKVGQGLIAGLTIVFMAVILDRISYGFSQQDLSRSVKLATGFRLFPQSWSRFGLVSRMEGWLETLCRGASWLASKVAELLAIVIGGLTTVAGKERGNSIRSAIQNRPLLWSSVVLLGGLLLIHAYLFPFGLAFPQSWNVALGEPVDLAVDWMRDNLYQIGDLPIGTGPLSDFLTLHVLNPIRGFLDTWLPWPLLIALVALIGYSVGSWRLAAFTAIGLFLLGLLGLWEESMNTLSQVIVAVLLTALIAIPLGVWSARSDRVEAALKPALDTLQTIPIFVYLIPVIVLFNVGRVPGIIASVLYALPPGIRLTNMGIRQIAPQTIEAAQAFGSSPRQILYKVQLPLALPSIALGINQITMMVLAMVVVAGLVGGGGLGLLAVKGLANPQKNLGVGLEAGLAIVIMAMVIDRITQRLADQ